MTNKTLNCPSCFAPLPEPALNLPEPQPCPICRTQIRVEVFPALFRPIEAGRTGDVVLTDTEASCFYHAEKRAVIPCAACGRFLCALCDCELHGQHYCPTCLETGKTKGKIKNLEATRTRYDNIALTLAVLPMLTIYLTIITAPIALFMVFWYWKSPRGLTQTSPATMITAGVLASLQIISWAGFFIYLFTRHA